MSGQILIQTDWQSDGITERNLEADINTSKIIPRMQRVKDNTAQHNAIA